MQSVAQVLLLQSVDARRILVDTVRFGGIRERGLFYAGRNPVEAVQALVSSFSTAAPGLGRGVTMDGANEPPKGGRGS